MSNDPDLPDPQEIASSLLSQYDKQTAGVRLSEKEKRRLGYDATMLALLVHSFNAHGLQRRHDLRRLVSEIAAQIAEMVPVEKRNDMHLLGIVEALANVSGLFATLLRKEGEPA